MMINGFHYPAVHCAVNVTLYPLMIASGFHSSNSASVFSGYMLHAFSQNLRETR